MCVQGFDPEKTCSGVRLNNPARVCGIIRVSRIICFRERFVCQTALVVGTLNCLIDELFFGKFGVFNFR